MNEEKKLPEEENSKDPQSPPETAAEETAEKNKTQKQGRRFLTFYIIALFSIALVLIGLSYVTQVKANRLNSQLTEQTTVAQGAKAKAAELQGLVTEQQKTIETYDRIFGIDANENPETVKKELDDKIQALDYLWRLEKNYQNQDIESCRQIIDQMETAYGEKLKDRKTGVLTEAAWDEYMAIRQAVAADTEE